MEPHGKVATGRMSPRVCDLFAAALRVCARLDLSVDLPELQARELAVVNNLESALACLRERLKIKRVLRGDGNPQAQIRLAVFEIAIEAATGRPVSAEDIERWVNARREAAVAESREHQRIRQAEKTLDEGQASSSAQRQFIRRAARLRTAQINRLRMEIADWESLDEAIRILDELYARYINEAMRI